MPQLDILFVSCTFIVSPKTSMKILTRLSSSTALMNLPNGKVKVPKKTLAYLKRRYHYYSKDPTICYQLYVDELFFCPIIDPENITSDIKVIELAYFRFKRECYQMVVGKTKDEIQCWLMSFFPIAKWEWDWFSYIKDNNISIRDVKLVFYTHFIMQLRTYNTLRHIFNSKKIKNKNDLYAFLNEPFNINKKKYIPPSSEGSGPLKNSNNKVLSSISSPSLASLRENKGYPYIPPSSEGSGPLRENKGVHAKKVPPSSGNKVYPNISNIRDYFPIE
jgi:hypothetical protein